MENVGVVDATHTVVGNHHLPFSSSREPHEANDNGFVLLRDRMPSHLLRSHPAQALASAEVIVPLGADDNGTAGCGV